MGLPRTKEQRLVHCGVVGHTGRVAPLLLLRSCSLFSRELVGLSSPSRTTPCSSALLLVELSVVQSGLLCCAPRSHSPHTTFHFYSRSFIASVASYANVESGKHRKNCESVWGHKNSHLVPKISIFHHRCPNSTDLAEKTSQNLLLRFILHMVAVKNTLLVQFSSMLGHFGTYLGHFGALKSPPVHWLWSL